MSDLAETGPDAAEPPLRADVLAFLDALAAAGQGMEGATLAERRERARAARLAWPQGGPPSAERLDLSLPVAGGSVAARLHRGALAAPAPTVVYFHGGGWMLLDVDTHDRVMREIAAASGWTVVGIDYPRAPETRFPDMVEVSAEAVRSLVTRAGTLGLDGECIVLAGDSAGGNLAFAVGQRLAAADRPVAGLILVYAVCDASLAQESYRLFGDPPYQLTPAKMREFWEVYCPDAALRRNPLASPLNADLAGLPPVLSIIAGNDILRDENRALAARLAAAAVPVEVREFEGMPHAFLEAFPFLPESFEAIAVGARWLQRLRLSR